MPIINLVTAANPEIKIKSNTASRANFQKILRGREAPFFVVIISVGLNAAAAYTRNNHACLRHKRFTDNDRDQQTYGSDPKKFRKLTIFFPQCKNTHAAVPEKLTIIFFWPYSFVWSILVNHI